MENGVAKEGWLESEIHLNCTLLFNMEI